MYRGLKRGRVAAVLVMNQGQGPGDQRRAERGSPAGAEDPARVGGHDTRARCGEIDQGVTVVQEVAELVVEIRGRDPDTGIFRSILDYSPHVFLWLGDFAYTVNPGFVAIPVGPDNTEAVLDGAAWGALLSSMEALGVP